MPAIPSLSRLAGASVPKPDSRALSSELQVGEVREACGEEYEHADAERGQDAGAGPRPARIVEHDHHEEGHDPGQGTDVPDQREAGVDVPDEADQGGHDDGRPGGQEAEDRKSTRLNSSHANISYAVFCLKKNKITQPVH